MDHVILLNLFYNVTIVIKNIISSINLKKKNSGTPWLRDFSFSLATIVKIDFCKTCVFIMLAFIVIIIKIDS